MVSFICCKNNDNEFNNLLLPSLEILDGKIDYNLFVITDGKSAASAYNLCLQDNWDKIGETVIFLHQDIAFDSIKFVERIESDLTENPYQILGVAGMNQTGGTLSNLRYKDNGNFLTRTQIQEKTEVLTVDECFFATSKKILSKIKFDEKICYHWHLYAVDLCYASKDFGVKSFVMPYIIYHKFNGENGLRTDFHFLKTFYKLARKYKSSYHQISTPCYRSITSNPSLFLKVLRTQIKNLIKR